MLQDQDQDRLSDGELPKLQWKLRNRSGKTYRKPDYVYDEPHNEYLDKVIDNSDNSVRARAASWSNSVKAAVVVR